MYIFESLRGFIPSADRISYKPSGLVWFTPTHRETVVLLYSDLFFEIVDNCVHNIVKEEVQFYW